MRNLAVTSASESILLDMEPLLKIRYTGRERGLVPEYPSGQCTRCVGLTPMFTPSSVSFDIPRPTSHILVLRIVAVARGSEGNHALLVILLTHRIPLRALGS